MRLVARSLALVLVLACGGGAAGHPPRPLDSELALLAGLARELGAPGGEVELGCLSGEPPPRPCSRHPLSAFFSTLERLERPGTEERVRVAVFGNSLIAADGIVGFLRRRLVARFGDGGRGLVLADRMGPWGPRTRTGFARGPWTLSTVGMLAMPTLPHGVTGAQHQATGPGARTEYFLDEETHAEVWWLPTAARRGLRLQVDGEPFAALPPLRAGNPVRVPVELPAGARSLEFAADGAGPVVQGVVLERAGGGLVVDTLGVPSVDATLFLRTDEEAFVQQLAARAPALVVVMLGGNEVKRLAWHRATLARQETDLRAFLRRTRQAVPKAACLVVGPIDSVRGPGKPEPFEQRPELAPYQLLQRRIAREEQCAYFDLYAAMGGPGSLRRFHAHHFVHADLVHPRGQGLNLLGELLASALLRAYDGRAVEAGAPD